MQTPEPQPSGPESTAKIERGPAGAIEGELARSRRLNQRLWTACALLAILCAGVVGYLVGARQGRSLVQQVSLPAAISPLPDSKRPLLEGIRCSHGNPMADAQCEAAIETRRFILTMLQQGDSDDKIKASLLRKYGEQTLSGRRW